MKIRNRILTAIKAIILGNPFFHEELLDVVSNLDDDQLQRSLVVISILDREKRKISNDRVLKEYLEVENWKIEHVKSELDKLLQKNQFNAKFAEALLRTL